MSPIPIVGSSLILRHALRQIARNDEDPNVRIAAVQKLNSNSEYELKQIALKDSNPRVREAAVRRLG